QQKKDKKSAQGMDSAVKGRVSGCGYARREPIGRVSPKDTNQYKAKPIRADQDWSPSTSPSGGHSSPEANCIEQIQEAGQDKVYNLNPAPVTKREKTKQIEPWVKTRTGIILYE